MTEREKQLSVGTSTGNYPPGTTAAELAKVMTEWWDSMEDGQLISGNHTLLHWAAENGHFPLGTTIDDLSQPDSREGTPLLQGIQHGHLPPGANAAELAAVRRANGVTALHWAATSRCYPAGTTAQDLITARTDLGWTAMHAAAEELNLLPGTTFKHLLESKAHDGETPLDRLLFPVTDTERGEAVQAQYKALLDSSIACHDQPQTSDPKDIQKIVRHLGATHPVQTVLWLAKEIHLQIALRRAN